MRPCIEPGCPYVTASTRCRTHQVAADRAKDAARGNTTARGYGAVWQALSAAVLRRDRGTCAYCGGPATTVDHIVPKAHGGDDSLVNLIAACRSCNSSKGARSFSDRGQR